MVKRLDEWNAEMMQERSNWRKVEPVLRAYHHFRLEYRRRPVHQVEDELIRTLDQIFGDAPDMHPDAVEARRYVKGSGGWQEARERIQEELAIDRDKWKRKRTSVRCDDIQTMLDEVDRLNKQLICEVCACNRPPYGVASVCSDHYGQIVKDHDEYEERIEELEAALQYMRGIKLEGGVRDE